MVTVRSFIILLYFVWFVWDFSYNMTVKDSPEVVMPRKYVNIYIYDTTRKAEMVQCKVTVWLWNKYFNSMHAYCKEKGYCEITKGKMYGKEHVYQLSIYWTQSLQLYDGAIIQESIVMENLCFSLFFICIDNSHMFYHTYSITLSFELNVC